METIEETNNYLRFLNAQRQEQKESANRMQETLDEIKVELKDANRSNAKLLETIVSLTGEL